MVTYPLRSGLQLYSVILSPKSKKYGLPSVVSMISSPPSVAMGIGPRRLDGDDVDDEDEPFLEETAPIAISSVANKTVIETTIANVLTILHEKLDRTCDDKEGLREWKSV